jgi:hypothetical protein
MGPGKHLRFKAAEGATVLQVPLKDFRDAQLLAVLRGDGGQGVYWHTFTKAHGQNKACARQVTTLTRDYTHLMPTFNYCHGAGRIDFTSAGVADPYYAGFKKHLLWFSEPTIGHIGFAGPAQWAVVYTRLGELQTQHPDNKRVDPDTDEIPGWFFHPTGNFDMLLAEAVIFKGSDNEPPAKVTNVKRRIEKDKVVLSWDKAADNTLVVWYKVLAGEGQDAQTVAEAAELSATLAPADVKGRALRVCAVDFFENVSEPSDPVKVE